MGLAVLATWLPDEIIFRYSSLSALVAAIAAPIYAMIFHLPIELVIATAIMSLLLLWRHKSNIQNLMTGKESKWAAKSKSL